jgi:hypothetical protein
MPQRCHFLRFSSSWTTGTDPPAFHGQMPCTHLFAVQFSALRMLLVRVSQMIPRKVSQARFNHPAFAHLVPRGLLARSRTSSLAPSKTKALAVLLGRTVSCLQIPMTWHASALPDTTWTHAHWKTRQPTVPWIALCFRSAPLAILQPDIRALRQPFATPFISMRFLRRPRLLIACAPLRLHAIPPVTLSSGKLTHLIGFASRSRHAIARHTSRMTWVRS